MSKKLYSLGDSFMTVDEPDEGIIGFCELYARSKSFEHVSLARPGATNFAIRLQIDRAIKDRADYVVIGLTSSDRFDILLGSAESIPQYQLDHVRYSEYKAQSLRHVDQSDVKIISDTFNNITQNHLVSDQQIQTLKDYVACLHDPGLASQKDYYMISDGLRRLQESDIEFVLIPGWLNQHDWSWVGCVWPNNKPSPYSMPYGPSDWERPIRFTNTHNPAWAHQEFCQTLLDVTKHWS